MLFLMDKTCPDCKRTLPIDSFGKDSRRPDGHNTYCRECVNAKAAAYREKVGSKEYSQYQMQYRKSTPERAEKYRRVQRNVAFKAKYGITLDEWEQKKAAQRGRCAICFSPFTSDKETHVDHDHATGAVRDLVCHTCNLMLGYAKDDVAVLANAINYLERHAQGKAA